MHRKGPLTPEMGRRERRGWAQLEMPHTLLWEGKRMVLLAKDLPFLRQADSMVICGDREGTAWGQEPAERIKNDNQQRRALGRGAEPGDMQNHWA